MIDNLKRNPDVDIFIYSHKDFTPLVSDHVFKVLTNCKTPINTDLEVFRDYTGDNISDKNLMYNEYTGFYWLWKNYPLKKYIGLNHYRRYYLDDNNNVMQGENMPIIGDIFKKHDIILNEKYPLMLSRGYAFNNRDWYAYWHNIEDFDIIGNIIRDKYTKYYDGFIKMSEVKYIYPSNLFIMNKDMFMEYCDFIFSLLMDFRKERGFFTTLDCVKYVENNKEKYIKNYSQYYDVNMQSRIIGYLCERVLLSFLLTKRKDGTTIEDSAKFFKWKVF